MLELRPIGRLQAADATKSQPRPGTLTTPMTCMQQACTPKNKLGTIATAAPPQRTVHNYCTPNGAACMPPSLRAGAEQHTVWGRNPCWTQQEHAFKFLVILTSLTPTRPLPAEHSGGGVPRVAPFLPCCMSAGCCAEFHKTEAADSGSHMVHELTRPRR